MIAYDAFASALAKIPNGSGWRKCEPCDVLWKGEQGCWVCGEQGCPHRRPFVTSQYSPGDSHPLREDSVMARMMADRAEVASAGV